MILFYFFCRRHGISW